MGKDQIRILFRGSYDSFNFGDDLLLVGLLRFLGRDAGLDGETLEVYVRREFGSLDQLGCEFDVPLRTSKEIDDILRVRLKARLPNAPRLVRRLAMLFACAALVLSICIFRVTGRYIVFGDLIRFWAGLDIIHYKGGGYIAGRWRVRLFREYLTIRAARMANPRVKIVGTGIGLGSFAGRWERWLLKAFLSRFDYLFVREHRSLDAIKALCPRLDRDPERDESRLGTHVRCLGDDALLLIPFLARLHPAALGLTTAPGIATSGRGGRDPAPSTVSTSSMPSTQSIAPLVPPATAPPVAALNLKDFPDHHYDLIAHKVDELLAILRDRKFRVEYFSFGRRPGPDDLGALEGLHLKNRGIIEAVHDPYEEGFDRFLVNLATARLGFGFAFHFVTLLAMMNRQPIAAYEGDYYHQKMQGAGEFFDLPFVFDLRNIVNLDLKAIVDQTLARSVPVRASKETPHGVTTSRTQYLEMVRAYAAMYRELVRP